MFCYSRSGTYIDVGDVGVLVDVHVGDLVTGVWAQGPVTRLAGAGAGAEAGGEEAGVLVRGARQRGAARPAGDQPRAGHRVRPPRPEASCGRRGAAVKIRAHSRLQWVVSMRARSELRRWGTRTRAEKTGPMSALIWAFRVMLMAFLHLQRLQIAKIMLFLATKYFNDKEISIINPKDYKNWIKITQTRSHTTWIYCSTTSNIKQPNLMWNGDKKIINK